ncbi:MAG TPA: hypothetical protein VFM43_01420 [Gaiellaceae bacterium]|nr:hypothetical protein [Gaiellaceae bacterium]
MSELKRRYRRKALRPLLALAALAAFAVVLTPAGSAGTTNKPFTATFGSTVVPAAPSYVPAFGTAGDGSVSLTIKDTARNQGLGSANIYAPAGVTITGADIAATNLDPSQQPFPAAGANTLKLRNLNLATNGTFSTTIYVSAPSCGNFTWNADAHQSNDYNSLPGNMLTLDVAHSSLSTLSVKGCNLVWKFQPASANQGATITDTAFTPSGTGVNTVAVEVVDSSNNPVALNTGFATLSMVTGSFDDCGTGCTPSFDGAGLTSGNFQGGVATFPNFKSNFTGTGFTMKATAFGLTSSTSSPPFVIQPDGLNCVGKDPCVLDKSFGNQGSVDISGHGGHFLFLAINSSPIPADQLAAGGGCAFFTGVGVRFAELEARNGDGTLDVTLSIPNNQLKAAYGPNYGNPNVPICAGAKRLDASGNPVSCQTDVANGLTGFADRKIDPSTHLFNGQYDVAKCGSDGNWWGVLGTYQDPDPPFDSGAIPLVTSWGGTINSGSRTFVLHEPSGWDGHFGY